MPNRNAETELEETQKVAWIAKQRGEHSRLVPQGLCPLPKAVVRNLRVLERPGCDEVPNVFLIGRWWDNWESASSTFWFQPVWGLHACGQHPVDVFFPVGALAPVRELQGHSAEYYLQPLKNGRSLTLLNGWIFITVSFFLCIFFTSLIKLVFD